MMYHNSTGQDTSHPATGLEAKLFANILDVVHINKNSLCTVVVFIDFIHSFIYLCLYLLTWQQISQVWTMGPSDLKHVVHALLHISLLILFYLHKSLTIVIMTNYY